MHVEILVEDASGKAALDILVPKIIGGQHTFQVHPYKGIGRIPKNLTSSAGAGHHLLLNQLPKLLRGYGKTFAGYAAGYESAVIVVCDLDDKCLKAFRQELFAMLHACNPKPETRFCIAIEEGEAWLLADAICPGGSSGLKHKGWQAVGREKSRWSKNIAPRMDVDNNASPSFQYFCRKLRELV